MERTFGFMCLSIADDGHKMDISNRDKGNDSFSFDDDQIDEDEQDDARDLINTTKKKSVLKQVFNTVEPLWNILISNNVE